jgi:3-hydroxyisobutyrate dehydrogenase-like beta-hydroxyacid dehydrogenase
MNQQLSIVGTGLMGTALAERFLAAGMQVSVYDRERSHAEQAIAHGAVWSDRPLAASDVVVFSLFTTETVNAVLSQMDEDLARGMLLIDTTTGSPAETAALGRRMQERGIDYVDAPVSGSSEQTRAGTALVLCGGSQEAFERARPFLEAVSPRVRHVGPCGSGSQMKLVTNLVLGLNRAALAEGLVFAEAVGFDPGLALEVLLESAAYSKIMDSKGTKMVEGDYSPAARLAQHLKDVGLIEEIARDADLELPLTEAHRRLLQAAMSAGYAEADNSAVIKGYLPGRKSEVGSRGTQSGKRKAESRAHFKDDASDSGSVS